MPIQTRRGAARFANASASLFLLAEALSRAGPAPPWQRNSQSGGFPIEFSDTCLFPFPRVTEFAHSLLRLSRR